MTTSNPDLNQIPAGIKCRPRRHMPASVCEFYWFALNLYKKIGVFRRSDRKHAADYSVDGAYTSKNTIGRWIKFLEAEGWMMPRRTGNDRFLRDKETGKTVSIPYDILTHDEWALAHPGSCFNPKSEPNPIQIGTGKKRFLTSEIERQRNRDRKARSRQLEDTDSKAHLQKSSPQDGDRLQSPTWTETSPQDGGTSCPQDGDVSSKVSSKSGSKSGSKRFVGENSEKPKTETLLPFPSDLTVTVGSQISLFASLEELLSQISDGELETEKMINNYGYREELQNACVQAVELQAHTPFNRKSLGDVMGKVMDLLKDQHDLKAPKAWPIVMRELRKGGTCKTSVNMEPIPEPMDPRAAWEAGRRALGF